MLLLLLLLLSPGGGRAQRVQGQKKNNSCVCLVDSNLWSFPVEKYESVQQQVLSCNGSLDNLQELVESSSQLLPQFQVLLDNVTARLEPYEYLHHKGLYADLSLRQLSQELGQLEADIDSIHSQLNNGQTQKISKEVGNLRKVVDRMKMSDTYNMKAVKDRLRYLKNSVESCKSIPKDFSGQGRYCFKGLIKSISTPVTTLTSPQGKSHISGSWGRQAQVDSEGQKDSYWVQPLRSSNIYGNSLHLYQTYQDFMSASKQRDITIVSSYSHADSVEGPAAVLYGEALYYHCYRSADVCRYDINGNTVKRVTLPGTGVGFNNKFPYCYFDCRANSDVDVEADETGLWAIYATLGNHGNVVVSQLVWDGEAETLNVSRTWETRLFKRAVSNAFMACGVLYASRYVDEYREEVFYAFDTATGQEDNTLALPLEKIAKGVASLSYNPTDKHIYMYNDGYLLAYQAHF